MAKIMEAEFCHASLDGFFDLVVDQPLCYRLAVIERKDTAIDVRDDGAATQSGFDLVQNGLAPSLLTAIFGHRWFSCARRRALQRHGLRRSQRRST